jgi:hypothetical protein
MGAAIGKSLLVAWVLTAVVVTDVYAVTTWVPQHGAAYYFLVAFYTGLTVAFLIGARVWEDIAGDWRER